MTESALSGYSLSVVSIWYNQSHYLESFIASLCHQTFQDFDVVFVDDGSSDGLSEAIDEHCLDVSFNWVYVRRPDSGFRLNTCRNYGLSLASGNGVVFLDGDMLPHGNLLLRHATNLEGGADCSVGSRIRRAEAGVASDERFHIFLHELWRPKPYLYAFGCNLGVGRDFVGRHGIRFDERYDGKYGMDDVDFAYQVFAHGGVFKFDLYAKARHLPVDYPSLRKFDDSVSNYDKFRKNRGESGIIQAGSVFFEHKYSADLYRKVLGSEANMGDEQRSIVIGRVACRGEEQLVKVGYGDPVVVIAEAGLNHNGEFELAKRMIELAAVAGATCVKFQKRDVDQMATRLVYETTKSPIPELGETYREVREQHELTLEEFRQLKGLAESLGLIFMVTPFDMQSVEFCEELGVCCYKIASHSLTDLPTVRKVASLRKPLFLSTGMSTLEEIDAAVKAIREYHSDMVLLHCVSSYPHSDEDTNLNIMNFLRDRYGCLVGYSGHDEGTTVTVAAVVKGALAVERHFTMDKKLPGFDHSLSLSPQELFTLCSDIRRVEKAMGTTEKKVLVSERLARDSYRRSLVTAVSLRMGHVFTEDDLTVKEPGTGISPVDIEKVIGAKLLLDLDADVTLEWRHIDQ